MALRDPNSYQRPLSPEQRLETFTVAEKLQREIEPAIKILEALRARAVGPDVTKINLAIISMQGGLRSTIRTGDHEGRIKISVDNKNDQHEYDQYEGVPLDGALQILKSAEAAMPASNREKAEIQRIIKVLEKHSINYFDRHFGKKQADVVSGRVALTPEESDKQDLRVRHEAKLIDGDQTRRSTKPDNDERLKENYENGKKDLDQRVEWNYTALELPTTVGLVEASHNAETLAKMRTKAELNKRQNQGFFLKRWWNRAMEEGIKQKLYEEELRKISGHAKQPNWFAKTILRRKVGESDGQNMFRDTDPTGKESKEELAALAKRFVDNNIRVSENEQRKQISDQQFNTRISQLVEEYANGHMTDAEFESRKEVLVLDIKKKYPSDFKKGVLTADNFLEAARVFRKQYEHGRGLSRVHVNLNIILGESRSRIKSEENLTWTENLVNKVNKTAIGKFVKPATLGYLASAAGYFFKKPVYGFLGAFGAGGLFGMIRRGKQVKEDIAMHRAEREAGITDANWDPNTAKRRHKVEQFVTNMEKASELSARITAAKQAYERQATPETYAELVKHVANAEARMSLSAQRQRGLIEYDGEASLERTSMLLMKELAEAKVVAGIGDIAQTAEYKNTIKELTKDVNAKDKKAESYKRMEKFKAFMVGSATGLVAGVLAQELSDEAGEAIHHYMDQFGMNGNNWLTRTLDRPPHSTALEKVKDYILTHRHMPSSGQSWWNWFKPQYVGCEGGPNISNAVREVTGYPVHGLKLDDSLRLIQDRALGGNTYSIVDRNNGHFIQHVMFQNGKMEPMGGAGWSSELVHNETPITIPGGGGGGHGGAGGSPGTWWDSVKGHLGGFSQERHINVSYDNDTSDFDLNELKLFMNQDGSGKIHADLSHIVENQSFHGTEMLTRAHLDLEHIKLVITDSHFPNPIVLSADNNGQLVIPDELKSFIEFKPNGTINYKGDGWIGMVEQLDGPSKYGNGVDMNIINSIKGDGSVMLEAGKGSALGLTYFEKEGSGSSTVYDHILQRRFNNAQDCGTGQFDPPMFVPFYRRNQLEALTPSESSANNSGTETNTTLPLQSQEQSRHSPEQIEGMSQEERGLAAQSELASLINAGQIVSADRFSEIVSRCKLTPEQKAQVLENSLDQAGVANWREKLEEQKQIHEQGNQTLQATGQPTVPFEGEYKEKTLLQILQEAQTNRARAQQLRENIARRRGQNEQGEAEEESGQDDLDDSDDEIQTTQNRESSARESQTNKERALEAIGDFNNDDENINPHIQIKVDPILVSKHPMVVMRKIQELKDLFSDPAYRNSQFDERIVKITYKPTEDFKCYEKNGDLIIEAGFNAPRNEIRARYIKYLLRGRAPHQAPAEPTPAARNPQTPEPNRPVANGPEFGALSQEIINDNKYKVNGHHRIGFADGFMADNNPNKGELLAKVKEAFDGLPQEVKARILNRENPNFNADPKPKGIFLGLAESGNTIEFNNKDVFVIPFGKTAAEIKQALIDKFPAAPAAPANPARPARPPAPARH